MSSSHVELSGFLVSHLSNNLMSAGRFTGSDLWNRMSTSFGYLNKYGYGGHVFPIVIGESGSQYTDVRPENLTSKQPVSMLVRSCGNLHEHACAYQL